MSIETVSDDREAIAGVLKRLADLEEVRFVFTTGGTGLTVDDVTPEATRDVIDREAPGYAEAIRADSRDAHAARAAVARRVRGAWAHADRELPRNPKAIDQSWPIVEPTLKHAAETLERDLGNTDPAGDGRREVNHPRPGSAGRGSAFTVRMRAA